MPKNRSSATRSTVPPPTQANEDAPMEATVPAEEQDVSMSGDESSVVVEEEDQNKSSKEIIELGEDYSESEAEESGLDSYSESEESEGEESEAEDAEGEEAEDPEPGAPEHRDSEAPGDAESEASEDGDSNMECDSDYMFEDANVNLRADNLQFWIHEHMLQGFTRLKSKLGRILWDEEEEWKVITLDDSAEDIQNMLAVIYSKPYESNEWYPATLESTLKLATKYDHANLRDYAITELDRCTLGPIDRFRIARDYNISGWRSKAMDNLVNRDAPITASEADILGSEIFAKIAAKREKLQYKRGQRAATN